MTALAAYRDGLRRVAHAPAVLAGFFAVVLIVSAPAALLVRDALVRALGASVVAERMAAGFDLQWWQEFHATAQGLAAELAPSVIGFAAVLRNLGDLTGGSSVSRASWLLVLVWLVVGTVLSGGILDRYARQRALRAHGFFAACGRLGGRLLRLNLLVGLVYAAILGGYALVARPLFAWATRDLASERIAVVWAAGFALLAVLLAAAITSVADCARVRMVVEDRRSALFALVAGARFARRSVRPLIGLYCLLAVTAAAVMLVYAVVAPGATWAWPWVWIGWLVSQAYILARVFAKLLTYAAVTSLFQSALAHAEYAASPAPVWPESPAVETLGSIEAGERVAPF